MHRHGAGGGEPFSINDAEDHHGDLILDDDDDEGEEGGEEEALLENSDPYDDEATLYVKRRSVYTLYNLTRTRPPPQLDGLSSEEDYYLTASTAANPTSSIPNDELTQNTSLNRCLTWVDLAFYGIGSTVGASIFVITGQVAASYAGPGIIFSFALAGIVALISGLAYCEFSARIPLSGSAYTFTYATLGEFVGWFIGWDITVEYAISASAVTQGWSSGIENILEIFGVDVPYWLSRNDVNEYVSLNPLSAFVIIACTVILLSGVKGSSRFNNIMTVLNICTILFLTGLGAFYVSPSNWVPFFPFGVNGVIRGAGKVFFSYVGFDAVTALAGEVKKPKKHLPIGIFATLSTATSLYIISSLVVTGMVEYKKIAQEAAFSSAFTFHKVKWAAVLITATSITTMTATTLCSLLGQPRILFQMASDGLLMKPFMRLNNRQVPYIGIISTGVFSTILALFMNLDQLSSMISIGTLLAFTLVCGGVVVLRYSDTPAPFQGPQLVATLFGTFFCCVLFGVAVRLQWPTLYILLSLLPFLACVGILYWAKPTIQYTDDAFRCPFVPVLPCLGMLFNTVIIVQLEVWATVRVLLWSAMGMIIYFSYGIKHSTLNFQLASEKEKKRKNKAPKTK